MRDSDVKAYQEFFQPLLFYIDLSKLSYSKYLKNKIYLHALCLRKSNKKIYNLIVKTPAYIPRELHTDLIELINHYDIWMEQFKHEEKKKQYSLGDTFIFSQIDDQSAFPKNAEEKIITYCQNFRMHLESA